MRIRVCGVGWVPEGGHSELNRFSCPKSEVVAGAMPRRTQRTLRNVGDLHRLLRKNYSNTVYNSKF